MSTSDSTSSMRRCKRCGDEFPATPEYFRVQPRRNNWMNTVCRQCERTESRERYARKYKEHPEIFREYAKQNRIRHADCHKAYNAKWRAEHPDYGKQWREENKERQAENVRRWRKENPERTRANQAKFRQSAKYKQWQESHKDKRNSYHRQWSRNNKDKIATYRRKSRMKSPDALRMRSQRWFAAHPEKRRIYKQGRRALVAGLPTGYTSTDWRRALEYFNNSCAVCGRPPGLWHTIAADHWIPLTNPNCPGTVPTNIVPLCHGQGGCNNTKSNRDPLEWLTAEFGKRKAAQILKQIQAYFDSLSGDSE